MSENLTNPVYSLDIDFKTIKDNIMLKLVNTEQSTNLINVCPSIKFLDLSILSYINISDDNSDIGVVIPITNDLFKRWNISKNELYKIGCRNIKRKYRNIILPLETIISGNIENNAIDITIHGKTLEDEGINKQEIIDIINSNPTKVFVLSNTMMRYGAVTMTFGDSLKEVSEKVYGSFYILPSSVHEVLIVPEHDNVFDDDVNRMKNMVSGVNKTLANGDILSNNVYYYDSDDGDIMLL